MIDKSEYRRGYSLIIIFLIMTIGIITVGSLYYKHYVHVYLLKEEQELQTITELKVNNLSQYRRDRLADISIVFKNSTFSKMMKHVLEKPQDRETLQYLQRWVKHYTEHYHYDQIRLLDNNGLDIFPSASNSIPISNTIIKEISNVQKSKRITFVDFYREDKIQNVYLSILVPILDDADENQLIGIIAFRIDPSIYLYPLIQLWPKSEQSAETLLTRRDGNDVVILNELKSNKNSPLNLKFPIEKNRELPVVMAALGKVGIVDGTDYRGVPVFTYMQTIPDSPWYLVSKIDKFEVYTAVREFLWIEIALIFSLIIFAAAGVWHVWRLQKKSFNHVHDESKKAIASSEEKYKILFNNINDAILIHSINGCFLEVNRIAVERLGYTYDELLSMSPQDIDSPEYGGKVKERSLEIAEKGHVVFETVHISKNGLNIPIELNSRLIEYDGNPAILSVARDISERKKNETALRESEIRFRELFNNIRSGVAIYEVKDYGNDFIFRDLNKAGEQLISENREKIVGHSVFDIRPGIKEFGLLDVFKRVWNSGVAQNHPMTLYQDKKLKGWFENFVYKLPSGEIVAVFDDVTDRKKYEKALMESKQKYRALVENSPDIILRFDDQCRHLFASNSVKKVTGIESEDFTGKSHRDLGFSKNLCDYWEKHIISVFESGQEVHEQFTYSFDNKTFIFDWRLVPEYGQNAKVSTVLSISRDITELMRVEENLRQTNIFLDSIIENLPLMIFIKDTKNLKFVRINKAGEKLLGYSKNELIGKTDYDFFTKPQADYFFEKDQQSIESKILVDIPEEEIQTRHKGIRKLHTKKIPILDTENNPLFILGISLDITDQKQAENQLLQYYEQYKTIITTTMDGFSLCDRSGHFLDVNDNLCKTLGYNREELINMSVVDIKLEKSQEEFEKHANKIIERGFERFENQYECKDGIIRNVETSVSYISSENKFIVFYRDITEKKNLEEQFLQAQKMESVGRLAGGVAHDFNNIITAISGNCEFALMLMDPGQVGFEEVEEIQKSAKRAAKLTRQLLAFSRKQIIEPQIINLNEIIKNLEKMLKRLIGENIQLELKFANDLWMMKIDPTQLEQLLTNLVVNAKDAIDDIGAITITTQNIVLDSGYTDKHIQMTSGEYVIMEIRDTGHGIDNSIKDKIFEPFFTTKDRGKGTGLGLSTCYGIAKQNNGFIWVYSEIDQGTVFKIYLPRHREKKDQAVMKFEPNDFPKGKGTILLVEDDVEVRNVTLKVLKNSGFTIYVEENGEKALKLLEKININDIDLLITDVVMPQMGGKDLADRINSLRPDIKILYMSGYTDNAIVDNSILDEKVLFINKPFSPIKFLNKVIEIINNK